MGRILEKPLRLVVLVGALAGLGLVLMSFDPRGARRVSRLEAETRAGEEHNRELRRENAHLANEIRALQSDPRAVERAARDELGLIKPGEVVFAF